MIALIGLFFSLTPVIWFIGHGSAIINGVDTNFPLNPIVWLGRRFFVWNDLVNGGGNFVSSTAGIFFHLIQAIPFKLGFSIQQVDMVSLVFWFAAIIVASFCLARVLVPKNKLGQVLFVLFYAFNTYLFNTWENVKVANLAVAVCLPAILALLIAKRNKYISNKKFIVFAVVISIFATGSGINPAYFLTLICAIFIYTICNLSTWRNSLVLLGILISINLYWMIGTFQFLLLSDKTITNINDIGFMNWVNDLSKNTSSVNVARIQGAWDWYTFDPGTNSPSYLPYVVNYFNNLPFVVFSFFLPFCAMLSFVLSSRKKIREYLLFGIFIIIGIFFGMGTHPPTGPIFAFLSAHVPFFSFFRSPWYIFTPFLTIALAGLFALLWENLQEKYKDKKAVFDILFIIILQVQILYSYPLVTGRIFRPSRQDGFYVNFPNYVFESEKFLEKLTADKDIRLLAYPDDGIENFNWGYRGLDTILSLFSNVETINPSLVKTSSFLESYKSVVYELLKRGEYNSVLNSFGLVSADGLYYKEDAATLAPPIDENKIKNLTSLTKVGQWGFALTDGEEKVFVPEKFYINYGNDESLARASVVLPKKAMVFNKDDSEVSKALVASNIKTLAIASLNTKDIGENQQQVTVDVPQDGRYFLYVEKYQIDFNRIKVTFGSQILPKEIEGDHFRFGPLDVKKGQVVVVINTGEEGYILADRYLATDQGKVRFSNFLPPGGFQFDPYSDYTLTYSYNSISGTLPITEAIQYSRDRFIQSFVNVEKTQSSTNGVLHIKPIRTPSKLDVFLTLEMATGGVNSQAMYQNVKIIRNFNNQISFVQDDSGLKTNNNFPTLNYNQMNPTEYNLEFENVRDGVFVVVGENYTRDWAIAGTNSQNVNHFTANGYANGWYIKGNEDFKIKIYYAPQRIFVLGLVFSGVAIVGWLFIGMKKENDK